MIKTFFRVFNIAFARRVGNRFMMATQRGPTGEKKIDLYKKIRERETGHMKNHAINEEILEKHYKHHRCDGCNSLLQSEDKQKYGYIKQEVLKHSVSENIKLIQSSYGAKVENSDSKTLEIIQDVQRELGVKIFNNHSKKLDNLDNVEVLLRLQEKIDDFEEQEQTIKRSKKQRSEIYCYRCYGLKYHNKLPEQYNLLDTFTPNNQQEIMDKVFKKHKELPVIYLYVVDILDIAGSFQKYLFDRLLNQKADFVVVVNKLDIANEKYLNKHLILQTIRNRMVQFIEDRQSPSRQEMMEKISNIKVFLTSNINKSGIKSLEAHIESTLVKRIQLVGFPNTGKTTLLNELAKLNRPTSKVPGTTVYITQSKYKKNLIFDMPGLHSSFNMYNLIDRPNLRSILAWNKLFSPPIMLGHAFFFGGKVEIKDTKIILFGLGGSCSSDNKWFLLNYKQFWKGLPPLSQLKMTKHQLDITFKDGKAQDIQIAGWGFIGLRLAIPKWRAVETRKLTLYLPKDIIFKLRDSVLSDHEIYKFKSNVVKRFRLQRIHKEKQEKSTISSTSHII